MNIDAVLQERGNRYGPFSNHAQITQSIKHACMGRAEYVTNWDILPAYQREALEMIAHKMGRILNGDPFYTDSWVDIVGYAQLVVDILEGKDT